MQKKDYTQKLFPTMDGNLLIEVDKQGSSNSEEKGKALQIEIVTNCKRKGNNLEKGCGMILWDGMKKWAVVFWKGAGEVIFRWGYGSTRMCKSKTELGLFTSQVGDLVYMQNFHWANVMAWDQKIITKLKDVAPGLSIATKMYLHYIIKKLLQKYSKVHSRTG